jgi:hypothetical protein
MLWEALKMGLYWAAPFLIKIYKLNYIRNSLRVYKMFDLLVIERWETDKLQSERRLGAVNKCAYCPGLLLLPDAKIRSLEIEVVSSWPTSEFEAASRR